MSIEVSGLNYYPIKSCAGTVDTELMVTETGFLNDRAWMIVDSQGTFMSQRKNPEMALIRPIVEAGQMKVNAPGMESLVIQDTPANDSAIETTVHKKTVSAISYGEDVSGWFSEYLKTTVELVKINPQQPRETTDRYHVSGASNRVGFADSFAFLLASEVSLEELNNHLEDPILMNRFRPNIVISGEDLKPYEEDYWRELKIGSMSAFIVRACDRCPIPDTDQLTGARDSRPVTAALRKTRYGIDETHPDKIKGSFFGQNLNHVFRLGQTIQVGDPIEVVCRSTKRNVALL